MRIYAALNLSQTFSWRWEDQNEKGEGKNVFEKTFIFDEVRGRGVNRIWEGGHAKKIGLKVVANQKNMVSKEVRSNKLPLKCCNESICNS